MAVRLSEDPWWFAAIGTIIVLLALDVAVPVLLVASTVSRTDRMDALLTEDEVSPPARSPSLALPVVSLLIAAGLAIFSGWKTYDEGELNSRWTWMLVAAGLAFLWAMLLLRMTINIGAKLAGA